jgi:L-arabonate dehydrase
VSSRASPYRSESWFAGDGLEPFFQRMALKTQGYSEADFRGRPVIGICNNWNEMSRCHLHFRRLAQAVKQGIWQAGGFPMEFPSMPMGADFARPGGISFMHRNLLAMEIEQTITVNPLDGVVLLGACDETIPGMLMAVASLDIPSIVLPGGPSLNGKWRGLEVGLSSDCNRFYADYKAGELTASEWRDLESVERSPGHCNTMGTASTMGCLAEVMGMALVGSATVPAVDSNRMRIAHAVGQRSVELVKEDLKPTRIMTRPAFDNAIRALSAIAGSTNAVIHLTAIAGRLGVDLPLGRFGELSNDTPVLVNVKPAGEYLMDDFYLAGGVPALLHELSPLLELSAMTVSGLTLGESIANTVTQDRRVIGTLDTPFYGGGGFRVLFGNLAPDGAVLKQSAASSTLLSNSGRAIVFDDYSDYVSRIDDPALDARKEDVLVLRNGGPRGAPGMPELACMNLPRNLLASGVRDMVRISDSRMSGTAFGTVVLHVCPEAWVGGPLAAVRTGDTIRLSATEGRIDLAVSERELRRRLAEWRPSTRSLRGYAGLYAEHVTQANEGCDLDFLRGARAV